MQYTDDIDLLL